MTLSPVLLICRCTLVVLFALGACDDEGGVNVGPDIETAVGPLEDGTVAPDTDATPAETIADAIEEEEADILYPGNVCGGDNQCSTGLCYGLATPQGAFEKPKCQSLCLQLEDFGRYCDSDDDCCKGRCCVDCGSREGLCVLD